VWIKKCGYLLERLFSSMYSFIQLQHCLTGSNVATARTSERFYLLVYNLQNNAHYSQHQYHVTIYRNQIWSASIDRMCTISTGLLFSGRQLIIIAWLAQCWTLPFPEHAPGSTIGSCKSGARSDSTVRSQLWHGWPNRQLQFLGKGATRLVAWMMCVSQQA